MSFRLAACQMNSKNDKEANLATASRLIDEAAEMGAHMVGLPEMFNLLGTNEEIAAGGEPIPGPTSEFLAQKARQHGIYLHGGSFMEKVEETGKVKKYDACI